MMSGVKLLFLILVFLSMTLKSHELISFQRWCNVTDPPGWVQYNDSLSSCVECAESTKLFLDRSSAERCCSGNFATTCGICNVGSTINCLNNNKYCANQECDGINDCGDASDERNNFALRNCSSICDVDGLFQCGFQPRKQCFSTNKVCDGSKNCADGFDETNCPFYGGICSGFLCVTLQQCISNLSVCNGIKDCADGSDEWVCYANGSQTLFSCDGVNPIGASIKTEQVCDGTNQCPNNLDETNCYFWTPWSSWTACSCETTEQTRSRKCVAYKRVDSHVDGQCNGLLNEGRTCDCSTPLISTTLIVIIALVSLIVLVGLGCIVYLCLTSNRKSNTEPSADNSSTMNNSTRFHASPGMTSFNGENKSLPVRNTIVERSPALSSYSQRSHLTLASVRHDSSYNDISPLRNSQTIAPPLPARPMSLDDPGYSSIIEVRSMEIDPYAQTKHIKVKTPRTTQSSLMMKTDSWDSFLNTRGEHEGTPQRKRTISRFPLEELGKAPNVPHLHRSRSMEVLDTDGYLVPTMSQKLKMDRKGQYTAMSSPEKGAPFRTTPTKAKGYAKVVKRQNRQKISVRRKKSLQKATSFSYSTNNGTQMGRNSPTHSESYTNVLMKNGKYQNIPDAKESLMKYISELDPPETDVMPARSPPPFKPPKLDTSISSHQTTESTPTTSPNNLGSQYDSLFAPSKTQNTVNGEEDYGKLEKDEIDLT